MIGVLTKSVGRNIFVTSMLSNKVICGDCLEKMRELLPDESVDLIYVDPPYFTKRELKFIWNDERRSFQDKKFVVRICSNCGKGVASTFCPNCGTPSERAKEIESTDLDSYLTWLELRIRECHRILKDTGSFFLHLDWRTVHYAKLMLDSIFGRKNFVNEIIWCYSGGGVPKNAFARKHQTILFYAKSKKRTFHLQFEPYSEATQARFSPLKDFRGEDGYIRPIPRGRHMVDWWADIPAVQLWSKQKVGYPTQKPLKLLDRIIRSASNPTDLILDPFCGSGTTLVAAHKLNRNWIGIDISSTSCRITIERLIKAGARIKFEDLI